MIHHPAHHASTPIAFVLALVLALAAPAAAVHADGLVALVPIETLGAESKASAKTEAIIARGLGQVEGHQVIPRSKVRRAIKRDPKLAACAGQAPCLARLGAALGATYVVFGELGGLGRAEVVYLELIDVAAKQSVRSTTLELGQDGADDSRKAAARAAAYRLLAPDRFVGRMRPQVDIEGASIYVDGQRMGRSPAPELELPVGSHAVRITHPEYHDYVRFVDIEFDRAEVVEARLTQYPIVASDMERDPNQRQGPVAPVIYRGQAPTPWYRQWYTVAGAGTLMLLTSALVVGAIADGIDADAEKVILPPAR